MADHGSEIGGDPSRIAVGGDGAGRNLAAVVTPMARERGNPRLIFQVLIYPVLDASTMRPSWWKESNVPTVSRETKNAILAVYLPVAGNLRDPLEMYRRQLDDEKSQRKLRRLDKRLLAVASQLQRIQTEEK